MGCTPASQHLEAETGSIMGIQDFKTSLDHTVNPGLKNR